MSFFKQKTAYEMRISDWSSDVCSSDLTGMRAAVFTAHATMEDEDAREDATFDRTTLALAIAGITLADLAALFASVSKRKRSEEALRQTRADLAHIQRVTTMGELAASISHAVMQPLGAGVANTQARSDEHTYEIQ